MGALTVIAGLTTSSLWAPLLLCILIGAVEAPALIGRNVALTTDLPEPHWTVGFSLLYSAGGVGYTIGSITAGQLIQHASTTAALTTTGVVIIALTAATTVVQRRLHRTTACAPEQVPAGAPIP